MASTVHGELRCPNCGSKRFDRPERDDDFSYEVTCADCGTRLGTWGEIREAFLKKAAAGLPGAVSDYLKRRK